MFIPKTSLGIRTTQKANVAEIKGLWDHVTGYKEYKQIGYKVIIHQVKTNKIITVKEVWKPSLD